MIQATGFPVNIAYAEKIARQSGANNAASSGAAMAVVDRVTLSPQGQAMNQAISQAIHQGEEPESLKPGELPRLILDFKELMRRAETGLREAMHQLGIPPGTRVSIHSNTDGTLTVESDSPQNAELEAVVNNNMDLRNALVGAETGAYLNRIGQAVAQAQAAADANPARADDYYNWLLNVTRQITGMGFEFDFADGKLAGSFLSNGQKIGLNENLEKLPA